MACYYPVTAYRLENGSIKFGTAFRDRGDTLGLPCGQCIGCRLERSRQWAVRCVHEASCHEDNCFLTLTYCDEFLPRASTLVYRDFQLFMKRFRKAYSDVDLRFYMCGEYGEECGNCGKSRIKCCCGAWITALGRPHYHAVIFGFDFPDKVFYFRSDAGFNVYLSAILDVLWGNGFCSVGAVSFQSAAYVARYIVKRVTGDLASAHYGERVPEFCHMSLGGRAKKGGIGAAWFDRYKTDVFPHDFVVINGVKMRPPKYYDKRFTKLDADSFALVSLARDTAARSHFEDNSDERLLVKEIVHRAAGRFLRRKI